MSADSAGQLAEMLTAYWQSQALYAAARFNLADRLAEGPKTAEQLAPECGAHADSLYRLMRALTSLGVLEEDASGRFTLTDFGQPLRTGGPGSMHALALMTGDEHFRAWGELTHSIETGQPAFDKVIGQPIFDYLAENPDKAAVFDAAMSDIHGHETAAVLGAYDFSGIERLADLGGGNGSNLKAILEQYPEMEGVLFDLPHVVSRAQDAWGETEPGRRCEFVAGSFFETVPPAEAYFLRHIIHDWDDERCQGILRLCAAALPPGGKVLVVEMVVPPPGEPSPVKLFDLVMLVIPGGRERTAEEFRQLYDRTEFDLARIVPTPGGVSVIEGVRR